MKQDRLTTWLVVGLLAYMLLLQGTVSAFAKASMTAGELGSTFVICAPSGEDYSETRDRLAGFAHDCCSSVCQLACATGPAALPIGDLVAPTRPTTEPIRTRYVALAVAPGELGLTSDARAPPFFSHRCPIYPCRERHHNAFFLENNMKLVSRFFAAALILAGSSAALAHGYHLGDIEVGHPWARATLPAAKVGGGYLIITNEGASADRLIGGSSPIAGRVEIHSMEIKEGVMTMRPLSDGLEVPAHETVELAPGGYHLMLMDLKEPLKEGERVPLTLEFEHAGSVDVELAVEAARPSAGEAAKGDNGHSGHAH